MIRLQKFLAQQGLASRRNAEEMIKAGRIQVNGQVVDTMGKVIDPSKDIVLVDQKPVDLEEELIYIILNKPKDFVTTCKDTHGRKTVLDLVKGLKTRLFPVGRLDKDTSGLLLLTNDGALTHRLTHPRFGVEKTYRVTVRGSIDDSCLKTLTSGVLLEDGITAPAKAKLLSGTKEWSIFLLTIHEGKNRQVRRMCGAVGHPVMELHRVSFGPLKLNGLSPGEWRTLTPKEVSYLQKEIKTKNSTLRGEKKRDEQRAGKGIGAGLHRKR